MLLLHSQIKITFLLGGYFITLAQARKRMQIKLKTHKTILINGLFHKSFE